MDNLGSLLGNKKFVEPSEVSMIKDYVRSRYKSEVGVSINDKQIIIIASGGALAGTLRLELPKLREHLRTDKKLVIRIG